MSIPCSKWYQGWWRTAGVAHVIILHKTVISLGLIEHSMKHESIQIPTCHSNSTCFAEIRMVHSLLLPCWVVLSVNSVNMDQSWMSNVDFLCELTAVIPLLASLHRMPKAVSSMVERVNPVTSNSLHSVNIAMWAFASKCFPIEQVPCSDGWRGTLWPTIHKKAVMAVCPIPQFK